MKIDIIKTDEGYDVYKFDDDLMVDYIWEALQTTEEVLNAVRILLEH